MLAAIRKIQKECEFWRDTRRASSEKRVYLLGKVNKVLETNSKSCCFVTCINTWTDSYQLHYHVELTIRMSLVLELEMTHLCVSLISLVFGCRSVCSSNKSKKLSALMGIPRICLCFSFIPECHKSVESRT